MFTIWVLALMLGTVAADVSLGYLYNPPKTSFEESIYHTGSYPVDSRYDETSSSGSKFNNAAHVDLTSGSGNSNNIFASGSGSKDSVSSGYNYNTQSSGTSSQTVERVGSSGYTYNTQGTSSGSESSYHTQPTVVTSGNLNAFGANSASHANQGSSIQSIQGTGGSGYNYNTHSSTNPGYNYITHGTSSGSESSYHTQPTVVTSGNLNAFGANSASHANQGSSSHSIQGTGGSGYNYNTHGTSTGSESSYYTQPTVIASGNLNAFGANSASHSYQGSSGQNTHSSLDGYYHTDGQNSANSQLVSSGHSIQYHPPREHESSSVYQQYYNQYAQQKPQIFKHFYVHAAPEELEAPKPRLPVLPPPQKHYKIIFIKAPAPQAPVQQFIPIPQQVEEKTIVYVLVKKPEDARDIVLPKFEQKPPTKPEVYFIKYNTKEDSEAAISNIVKDHNKYVATNYLGTSSELYGKTKDDATHRETASATYPDTSAYDTADQSNVNADTNESSKSSYDFNPSTESKDTSNRIFETYKEYADSKDSANSNEYGGGSSTHTGTSNENTENTYYTGYTHDSNASVYSGVANENAGAHATNNKDTTSVVSTSAAAGTPGNPNNYNKYNHNVNSAVYINYPLQSGANNANKKSSTSSSSENQNSDAVGTQYTSFNSTTTTYETSVFSHILENIFGTGNETSASSLDGHSEYDASTISASQGTPQNTYIQ